MLTQFPSPCAVTNTRTCRSTIQACESRQALQEAVCPAGKLLNEALYSGATVKIVLKVANGNLIAFQKYFSLHNLKLLFLSNHLPTSQESPDWRQKQVSGPAQAIWRSRWTVTVRESRWRGQSWSDSEDKTGLYTQRSMGKSLSSRHLNSLFTKYSICQKGQPSTNIPLCHRGARADVWISFCSTTAD